MWTRGLTPTSPRRRWLRRVVWIGLALLVSGAALSGWLYHRFGGQLESVFAETDRLDPYWRLDDLEAHRPVVPDAENGALRVSAIRVTSPARFLPGELPPERQLNVAQIQALDAILQTAGPDRLAAMRALADFPRGRHAIVYSPDWFSTLMPHLQGHREVGQMLRHDALARSQVGDADGAALDALAALSAGSSIGDEPFVVSQLARMACQSGAIDALERVLAQGEPSPDRLATLQRWLEELDAKPLVYWALRGQRAGLDRTLQYLQDVGTAGLATKWGIASKWKVFQAIAAVAGSSQGGYSDYEAALLYVPGNLMRQRAEVLRHMNQAIEIVKRPPEQWRPDLDAWEAQARQTSWLPRALLSTVGTVAEAGLRHHAQLRCAAAAVAAEQFRRQTGRWPAAIDELVKAGLLKAVLIDPYDGQPLRLKRLSDGLTVYSVGPDRADNGGNLHPTATPSGTDLGFRLWDVPARRQPPLPPESSDNDWP